jgi:hypothetical protein
MFPYSERGRDTATRLSQRDIATINAIYRLKAKTSSPENVRLSNFEDFRRKLVARGEYSDDTPMITFSGENPIVAANGKGQAGGRKKRRWWDTGPFDGMMVMPGWTNMRY